tara:strand:+ start:1597 stop:2451 length:855 start_codon:yes stop_codon:yes gene_type:complete
MESLHIFVTHYTPLTSRKEYILKQLNTHIGNIKIKDLGCEFDSEKEFYTLDDFNKNKTVNYVYFVRKYDRDYLTPIINSYFFLNNHDKIHNIRLEHRNVKDYLTKKVTYQNFKTKHNHSLQRKGPLSAAQKSLVLKHYECYRLIEQYNLKYALIIEDDCYFKDDFMNKLKIYMPEFPNDWDVYFLNGSTKAGLPKVKGGFENYNQFKNITIKNHPASIFTVSYMVTYNAAIKMRKYIEEYKIWLPIDHEQNWLFYILDLKVIWNRDNGKNLTIWGNSGFKSSLK